MAASDRGGQQRRKPGARQDPLLDQDQDQEEVQAVEAEQEQTRDTQQDQMGNQGIAEMLGMPSIQPGEAGHGLDSVDLSQERASDLDYGGDDDVPEDGPLTLDDLTRSWNQGTKRGKDAAVFDESMPVVDLPPEDSALIDAIRDDPTIPELPDWESLDAMVQPSEQAVAGDLTGWVRQALTWAQPGLAQRAVARLVLPPAPCLQDPHGRVILSRTRAAAIATLAVLDGPTLRHDPGPRTSAFVDACLELAGKAHVVETVHQQVRASDVKLPVAKTILASLLEHHRPTHVLPVPLPPGADARMRPVLTSIMDTLSADRLLPFADSLPGALDEEDLDPLGLDDVLAAFTGGRPDPMDGAFDASIQSAEALAAAGARLRVRVCGVSMAVAETADQWTTGAPTKNLLWLADQVDQEVNKTLQLLVEVARAAQARQVDPKGLRNGLKRAARWLDKATQQAVTLLGAVLGGVLPGVPDHLPPLTEAPHDVLTEAWADGTPRSALPWLSDHPAGLERDVAIVLTRAGAGEDATSLIEDLRACRDRAALDRPDLALILELCLGPCLLVAGMAAEALQLAESHVALGGERRNGMLVAAGAQLGIEAHRMGGDEGAADALRYRAAHLCWHMGGRGGLTLLARWRAPEADA